jgi:hypothetical protein
MKAARPAAPASVPLEGKRVAQLIASTALGFSR